MKRLRFVLAAITVCLSISTNARAAERESIQVAPCQTGILVDGRRADIFERRDGRFVKKNLVSYQGAVYIPMTTVGCWLGADPLWDEGESTVTFTSTGAGSVFSVDPAELLSGEDQDEAADPQLLTGGSIQMDGRTVGFTGAMGQEEEFILLQGEIYLPVRSVAGLLDREALWYGGRFHLYTLPTGEELDEAADYLAGFRARVVSAQTILREAREPRDQEEFRTIVRKLQAELKAAVDQPYPTFQGLDPYIEDLLMSARFALSASVDYFLPKEECTHSFDTFLAQRWLLDYREGYEQVDWECVSQDLLTAASDTSLIALERWISYAEGFLAAVRAATGESMAPVYLDADRIRYREAVDALSRLGVIQGKEDGRFDPEGGVTRAECAKLLASACKGGDSWEKGKPSFSDTEGHWAESYIEFCAAHQIISGRGDGRFDPDGPVTGAEMSKMLLVVLLNDFDATRLQGPQWAEEACRLAGELGLYAGLGEDFALDGPLSRDQAAQLLYNALAFRPRGPFLKDGLMG